MHMADVVSALITSKSLMLMADMEMVAAALVVFERAHDWLKSVHLLSECGWGAHAARGAGD
jgi:hypothetical protein